MTNSAPAAAMIRPIPLVLNSKTIVPSDVPPWASFALTGFSRTASSLVQSSKFKVQGWVKRTWNLEPGTLNSSSPISRQLRFELRRLDRLPIDDVARQFAARHGEH